jgi:hypothetical protein
MSAQRITNDQAAGARVCRLCTLPLVQPQDAVGAHPDCGPEWIVGQAVRLRRYSRGLTPSSRLKAALSA